MVDPGTRFALEGVALRFASTRALTDIDLEIEPGEAVAFVGPSGAGKTSLLRLLNGIHQPTAGRVRVDGSDLASLGRAELRAIRRSIGFVHQDLSLIPNLRVIHNVLIGRLGHQHLLGSIARAVFPSRADIVEIHRLLERVGIEEKLYERTDRLSGGQQQRVAIARALFQRPRALIADEPVASVDPARARDTVELLTGISREARLTLCMSLHSFELARENFPRLIGVRDGAIEFDRPSEEVGRPEFEKLYELDKDESWRDGQ